MDAEIADMVMKFVHKQKMGGRDKLMQAKNVVEEANELVDAVVTRGKFPFSDYGTDNEKEEVADVIITALIYAELSGFLDEVDELVREKMMVNLEKPVREHYGVKVSKGCMTKYLD